MKKIIKPFKSYREMDDTQKQKISNNPNLHASKPDSVKKKISDTMKARWAATPYKFAKNIDNGGTTIYDIMLEDE